MDLNELSNEVIDVVLDIGPRILIVLVIIWIVSRYCHRLVNRVVRNTMVNTKHVSESEFDKREETIVNIVSTFLRFVVWTVGGMVILGQFNIDIAPLLASASVLGIGLGFGAQNLVQDFLAGLFIIMENQYRIGDWVAINNISGRVEEITIRTTVLRDLDGNQHHISNGTIKISTNKTIGFSNINMDIGVSYDTDIDKLEKVINTIGMNLSESEDFGSQIIEAPKFYRVNEFSDSAVTIKILGKTVPGAQWKIAGELRREIKNEFEKNDIEIPYPHQVMKIQHANPKKATKKKK